MLDLVRQGVDLGGGVAIRLGLHDREASRRSAGVAHTLGDAGLEDWQAVTGQRLRHLRADTGALDGARDHKGGLQAAIDSLKAQSRPVQTRKEKAQVAAISAHMCLTAWNEPITRPNCWRSAA